MGEVGKAEQAQDLIFLDGKILRLNTDGTVPQDNPFPSSPVYSFATEIPRELPGSQGQIDYTKLNTDLAGV